SFEAALLFGRPFTPCTVARGAFRFKNPLARRLLGGPKRPGQSGRKDSDQNPAVLHSFSRPHPRSGKNPAFRFLQRSPHSTSMSRADPQRLTGTRFALSTS